MRYFGRDERAARYHATRPRVHERIIREFLNEGAVAPVTRALDVGCGTGHSTTALAAVSDTVVGLDVEPAMLLRARTDDAAALLALGDAERMPFADGAFGLVSASMAFHWLEPDRSLGEVARVLRPGGKLLVYNLWFPGEMPGTPEFSTWFVGRYLARYPSPARHRSTLEELVADRSEWGFVESRGFEFCVPFTRRTLRHYLTTQSNVEAAVREGAALVDIDAWLDAELAPFFAAEGARDLSYHGFAELATASGA